MSAVRNLVMPLYWHKPKIKVRHVIEVFFVSLSVMFLVLLSYNTLVLGGKYTPDSMVYKSVSYNMATGSGISISVLPLEEALSKNLPIPCPIVHYAPGYPIVTAIFGGRDVLVSLVFGGITLFMVFVLGRRYGLPCGFLGASLVMNMSSFGVAMSSAWSETMGLAFMVGTIFLLLISRSNQIWYLPILTGLVGGAAYFSRYAMAPLLVLGLLTLIRKDLKTTLRIWSMFTVSFFLVAGPILIRNHYYQMFGPQVASGQDLFVITNDLLMSIFQSIFQSLSIWGMFLFVLFTLVELYKGNKIGNWKNQIKAVYCLFLWVIVYSVFLVICESQLPLDRIGERLVLPATIVILVAIGIIWGNIAPKTSMAFSFFLVIALVLGQANEARFTSMLASRQGPRTKPEAIEWVYSHQRMGDLIVSSDGLGIPFYIPGAKVLYGQDCQNLDKDKVCRYASSNGFKRVLFITKDNEQMPGYVLEAKFDDRESVFSLLVGEKIADAR